MDHTSCLIFRVGTIEDLPLNKEKLNAWVEKIDSENGPSTIIDTRSAYSFSDSLGSINVPIAATVGHTKEEVIIYVQLLSGTELECKAESDRLYLSLKYDGNTQKEIQKFLSDSSLNVSYNEILTSTPQRVLILPNELRIDPTSKRSIFDRNDGIITLRFEKN